MPKLSRSIPSRTTLCMLPPPAYRHVSLEFAGHVPRRSHTTVRVSREYYFDLYPVACFADKLYYA